MTADRVSDDFEVVCYVPATGHQAGLGHLATPLSGACDIEWHVHLLRPKAKDSASREAPDGR